MTTNTLLLKEIADTQTIVLEELKELAGRVEQLEVSNSITTNHTELLLEFVKIVVEIPSGKQIFNRAINRQQLNKLRNIVLPRRKKALAEFFNKGENSKMPPGIKDQFVEEEMQLIRSVVRAIQHREYYEHHASDNVRNILTNLFSKINDTRTKMGKLVSEKKSIETKTNRSKHIHAIGGAHART